MTKRLLRTLRSTESVLARLPRFSTIRTHWKARTLNTRLTRRGFLLLGIQLVVCCSSSSRSGGATEFGLLPRDHRAPKKRNFIKKKKRKEHWPLPEETRLE